MTFRRDGGGLLSLIAIGVGLVGTIGGGIWAMESRYVHQVDFAVHLSQLASQRLETNEQIKNVQLDILESRRQALRREIFNMEQRAKYGRLTVDEQRYLNDLRDEEQRTTEKIRRLSR
jgi:hypothetical protein